jgi:Raf kinase inhibitor-like YbhB/YbcL family protein
MAEFTVASDSFQDGDYLGRTHILSESYGFGCAGENKSPQLSWANVPDGTQSFAVTCYDPDAPTGSGFWHWVLVNIPADVLSLDLDAGNPDGSNTPTGALEVRTDFSAPGYGGPCPPEGSHPHRYIFTVHAVGAAQLPVTADTSAAVVGFNLHFSTIAKATLMGLFKR